MASLELSMDDVNWSKDLGDGLLLRWGRPEDVEAVATFNVTQHSDDPEEPDAWLADWTRDLMDGEHPSTNAADFTVVIDTKNENKLVSTCCLISATWTYDGIPFGCGRPELISTDPDYRRRGLIRQQMDMLHAKSSARGELVQAITGIPWFYRQFGYEMTVEHFGGRSFQWLRLGNKWSTKEKELYRVRPATEDDIPTLQELYDVHRVPGLLKVERSAALWRFNGFTAARESSESWHLFMVETTVGETAAYIELRQWGHWFALRELSVYPQFALREVGLFLLNWFKAEAARRSANRKQPITHANLFFGSQHPIYDALDSYLNKPSKPYAWYIRVADVAAFLQHIRPVLEARLAASTMSGYSGKLRLNFYRSQLALVFEAGKLTAVSPYQAKEYSDADALFPEYTFYHILFGHRSLAEVNAIWPDCYAKNGETAVLIDILFPKRPSYLRALG